MNNKITNDPYNLKRFTDAQDNFYAQALSEIKNGKKESHWMWYIFPQLSGLGHSDTAKYYGISGIEEAREYLKNPTLREHLLEITAELYKCNGEIQDILGYPDYLKLQSCMTLFNLADPSLEVFNKVLEKFYSGEKDQNTLQFISFK